MRRLVVTQTVPLLLKLASLYPHLAQILWTVNIIGHKLKPIVTPVACFLYRNSRTIKVIYKYFFCYVSKASIMVVITGKLTSTHISRRWVYICRQIKELLSDVRE